jgi:GMP synthase (glutamine-hydrolysing)
MNINQGTASQEASRLARVTSTDGRTADFYSFDIKFLGETTTHIINEVKG